MTQFKYFGAVAATALMTLASCSDGELITAGSDGQGTLKVQLDLSTSVLAGRSESRAFADNGVVTVDDLALRLASPDGSYTKEWTSLADLAANPTVGVGDYTLSAYFGSLDAQGFDSPYYYGETELKVRENETTNVALTAQLANSMFTITYSEGLKKHLASYSAELQSGSLAVVEYPAEEVRPLYVKPGSVEVFVNIERKSGAQARLLAATVEAEPRHHYFVTVDINNGDAGGDAQLVVTFDDTLETEDYIVDLSDELFNGPAPEATPRGFASGDVLDRIVSVPYEGELGLDIIARGGLRQVKMTTEGAANISAAFPADIDLLAADAATQSTLKSLGFTAMGLWRNPDKQAVIDFAPIVEKVSIPKGETSADVKFTFTVVDKMGKATEPVTLAIHVENESIELLPGEEELIFGAETYTMNLRYNGADPATNLVVEMANNRGTWDAVEGATFSAKSRAMTDYLLTVPVDVSSSYKFRVTTVGRTVISETIDVERVYIDYEAEYVDAFATSAYFKATQKGGSQDGRNIAGLVSLFLSEDGGASWTAANAQAEGDYLVAKGLKAATAYSAKISLTKKAADGNEVGTFTTEAAAQLPYNLLSAGDWERVAGGTNYWWVDYLGPKDSTPWGTMNLLTTSVGNNKTSAINHKGCSYCAYSGTQPATVDGRECAYIATVGWGDNSAWGNANTKNLTAGQLYLGHYDSNSQSAVYDGLDYASRPASVTFAYKYAPFNAADWGVAEFELVSEDGSTIKTVSQNLTKAESFTEVTLSFNRTLNGAKPAKIKAKFLSSGNPDCLTPGSDNNTTVGLGNLSDGRFTGAELWIDDIILNY